MNEKPDEFSFSEFKISLYNSIIGLAFDISEINISEIDEAESIQLNDVECSLLKISKKMFDDEMEIRRKIHG